MTIQTQAWGYATDIADVFGYQPIDGIMGLGWPALAVPNDNPPMPPVQNLLPQLDAPLFTTWLDLRGLVFGDGQGGLITYGALDTDHCSPQVDYVPLSSRTYWQFPIQGFSIGSQSNTNVYQVISDTGTSWIGAPPGAVTQIVNAIGAQYDSLNQLYYVPCSAAGNLSDLVFNINGNAYPIRSQEYVEDLELGGGNCAVTLFGFGSGGGFGPAWILGDTFIRQYCNVYHVGDGTIGFSRSTTVPKKP